MTKLINLLLLSGIAVAFSLELTDFETALQLARKSNRNRKNYMADDALVLLIDCLDAQPETWN
eukprot:scaffold677311_cov94-Attheya_sp.AAC.1